MTANIKDWATATVYAVDDVVIVTGEAAQFNNRMYRCLVAHTSVSFATEWGIGNWEDIKTQGIQGLTGTQGPAGPTGATGATGAAGANGGAGADGIFSQIASEAEAEAGVNNTKGMTPLRTNDAIETNVPNLPIITTLQNSITANANDISSVSSRLLEVEAYSQVTRAMGEQRMENNTGPQQILGGDLPGLDGKGNRCELDPDGAHSASIVMEVYRKDDAEERFSRHYLELHYMSGTWYLAERDELVLSGIGSGVTFAVTQDAGGVATIDYTSDNMVGGNYDIVNSKVRFLLEEISKSV